MGSNKRPTPRGQLPRYLHMQLVNMRNESTQNKTMGPLTETCSRASSMFGDPEGSKGRMSPGFCPWEAQAVVFYVSRRLWELQILTALSCRVGPLKEPCSRVFEVWVFWTRGLELESGDSGFEVWGSSLWLSGSLDVRSSWFGGLWMSSPARSTAMGRRTANAVSFAFFFCFYSVCWSCEVFGGGAKVGAEAELCRQEGGAPLGRVVGPPLGQQSLVVKQ